MSQDLRRKAATLEDLATGELRPEIIEAIGQVEITIEDLLLWQATKPRFKLTMLDKHVIVDIHFKTTVRKVLLLLSSTGVITLMLAAIRHLMGM